MIKSFPFDAVIDQNGTPDRVYLAEDFARYFAKFIGTGVYPNPATGLQVVAIDSDMRIRIKKGDGYILGRDFENTDDYIIQLDVADGVLSRIDRVVLRLDYLDRKIKPILKKGNYASSPVAKSLQRDADAYEIALADVYVKNGVISIMQSNITDLRLNKELCGIVHGVIQQADTTEIFRQYQAWFNEQKNVHEGDFEKWVNEFKIATGKKFTDWVDDLKNSLDPSEDIAAKLQMQISENKSDLADITTKQGNLINLKTSNKTNLVSAVNELFQNANNGKNLISSVVGNPLLATDTFQQQSNKIQNLKNTFASNLTSKQQPSNSNESLNNLINKVANINTGKRFAVGTRTIAESGTTQLVVQIRGLSFTPSKVIVTGHYLDVRGDDTAFYSIESSTKDIYERYGRAVYGAYAAVFSHDSCGFDYSETKIVSNGFNIIISARNTDITLKYWAFE
ncbi:hypothetical protein N496_15290 [Clostridium botulinum A2B3 87]|uniref:methyl-accepting chemotaxis protein n=1 Tax=Clostridium botulinum TaxID=1491 RepID=UPI0004A5A79E|nr:methyl-accepting chemotaxis protein [Clostridium botulinum]KEI96552.1 hypothetical protein N496_15290 [Clostridium botulinum A2B3 87]